MRNSMKLAALAVSMVLGAAACGGKSKPAETTPATSQKSLYDRLGGKAAITMVVDDFVGNVASDARINAFFAKADINDLKAKITDQICQASGGPCTYAGKNMKEAHAGMGITEEQFGALVENLVKSLDKHNVAEPEKNELLAALGGMKADVVGQ